MNMIPTEAMTMPLQQGKDFSAPYWEDMDDEIPAQDDEGVEKTVDVTRCGRLDLENLEPRDSFDDPAISWEK